MHGIQPLFRRQALTAASSESLGSVVAVVPPSGFLGASIAIVCLAGIVAVAVLVRVPLKTDAIGILMPTGGLIDVVAIADGRIENVYRDAHARIGSGDLLFDVAAHSAVVDGVDSSRFRLQSVRREQDQLRRLRSARENVFEEQLGGLQQELKAVDSRRHLLARQLAAQQAALTAAERRLARFLPLAEDGHVSRDELDRQREQLLRDWATVAGIEQQAAGLDVERQSLLTRIGALHREREVSLAEFALRLEQLSRDIEASASRSHYSIRSPQDGVIESLLVAPGSLIRKGQVLAKLSRGSGLLEAWLYLPSTRASSLKPGQTVELRLDAWPKATFGSRTAAVYAVSSVPVSPEDISAPVSVNVPVFEIRARLIRQPVPPVHGRWTIPPGTTFRASVLQRHMRLYEWIIRNRPEVSADGNA